MLKAMLARYHRAKRDNKNNIPRGFNAFACELLWADSVPGISILVLGEGRGATSSITALYLEGDLSMSCLLSLERMLVGEPCKL